MIRKTLPGSKKLKITILLILLAISLVILVYEGINNKKNKVYDKGSIENAKILSEDEKKGTNSEELQEKNCEKLQNQREIDLYNEAYELFFSKEYNKSIEKSNQLIKEFPNSAKGYNMRGIAKSYNESFESGMTDIEKALEIEPKYGYAIFNKALTYELYGNLDDALIWYNKNLDIENYTWTYYGIASIYGRRGNVENTIKYLKKAIDIDDNVKSVAKEEADFNLVRSSKEFQNLLNN